MKILKGIITFVLVMVFFTLEICLGFMICSSTFVTEEAISKSIQEIDVQEILVDEKGEETKTAVQVYDILSHVNISKSDANIILNDSQFKKVVGDFVSSATMHQVDESVEIKYPSESDITDVIYNNFDALKESYQIDKSKDEVSRERIQEEVSKNYGNLKEKLQEYLDSLGGKNDQS